MENEIKESDGAVEIPLRGAGGEPVDLMRTIRSHGLASLPPMRRDDERGTFEVTLCADGAGSRTILVSPAGPGLARATIAGLPTGREEEAALVAGVRHVLRLDEDLSPFYELATRDPELSWAAAGAGRMVRSSSVFEEVVKTICTTNCAWSATERMVGAIVEHLGERAPGAPSSGPYGRAFPKPEAMAEAGENFYREVARAGYRGRYLLALSCSVAGGEVDLEVLGDAPPEELPDEELERRLLALPGVGPYAAAHIMTMLGRYSRLILDSWTRPTYARLSGRAATDAEILARFKPYGRYAGLAFWLYLTRGWVSTDPDSWSKDR